MKCENGTSKLLCGLLIGAAAGGAAAILLAPQSGKETRNKLKDEACKLKDEFEFQSYSLSERVSKIKSDFENFLHEMKSKLQGATENLTEDLNAETANVKNDLKKNTGA